jgi:hypothetical protein
MARRRTENLETTPDTIVDQTSVTPGDRRRRPRIIIPIGDDGAPDVERLDPVVLETLRARLEQTQPAPPEPISPVVIDMLVSMIGNIEAAVLAPKFGLEVQEAAMIIMPQDPLRAQIADAGARVLTKYSGALGRWQDEIVLASLLAAWQIQALNTLRATRAIREENDRRTGADKPVPVMQD